jgi:hypothetical protein
MIPYNRVGLKQTQMPSLVIARSGASRASVTSPVVCQTDARFSRDILAGEFEQPTRIWS